MSASIRKSVTVFFVAILLACLFSVGVSGLPNKQSVAHAGSNGQQLGFICYAGNLGNVTVTGENQDSQPGHYVVWRGSSPNGYGFDINGWWWKNHVWVDYYSGGQLKHVDGYVPVSQGEGDDIVEWGLC